MANKTPFAKLIGDKKLVRKLAELEKKAAKKIAKKVVRAGATVMKKSIKRHVPVDEGLLKKSIAAKIIRAGAILGASKDYSEGGEVPANYVHLVEYGHVKADGTVVQGKHPIERGAKAAEAEAGRKMEDKAQTELNKLL